MVTVASVASVALVTGSLVVSATTEETVALEVIVASLATAEIGLLQQR